MQRELPLSPLIASCVMQQPQGHCFKALAALPALIHRLTATHQMAQAHLRVFQRIGTKALYFCVHSRGWNKSKFTGKAQCSAKKECAEAEFLMQLT